MFVRQAELWHRRALEKGGFLQKSILQLASYGYRLGALTHKMLYKSGLMKRYQSRLPLVCVGNITVGGTGKTPFIILLGRALTPCHNVAVISRGYRSRAERMRGVTLMSEGEGPLWGPDEGGDEPFMLAKALPRALVITGKSRVKAARLAESKNVDLILLDDGLQHHKIKKDIKIVMLSSSDPFGKHYFLPRGYLRESPKELKNADLIVINGTSDRSQYDSLVKEVKKFSAAPTIGTKLLLAPFLEKEGQKVGAFCGIGNPKRFFDALKAEGAVLVKKHELPDHTPFEEEALETFIASSKEAGAELILCTEKDAVKLKKSEGYALPIRTVDAEMEVIFDNETWTNWLGRAFYKKGTL